MLSVFISLAIAVVTTLIVLTWLTNVSNHAIYTNNISNLAGIDVVSRTTERNTSESEHINKCSLNNSDRTQSLTTC
jgi:hypothetical protein